VVPEIREHPMVEKAEIKVIGALIERVQQCHAEAGLVREAANTFAKRGKVDRTLKTMMDFEGPTRDALDLFKTALTIKRELLVPDN
jgi:hypothetical protein